MLCVGVPALFKYTKGIWSMNTIDLSPLPEIMTPDKISTLVGTTVTLSGCVYKIRRASGIVFVSITHDRFIYQCVYIPEICKNSLGELWEGAYIELVADVKEEKRADYGVEFTMKSFKVLSKPTDEYPICITQPTLICNLTENLNNRTVALRHPKEIATMSVVNRVKYSFTQSLNKMGFSSVTTPKISTIPDNTTDYIKVKYFGNDCNLALSPHYYKQLALCAFSRVYEIATCYSDVNRNSTRHLNEFTRLDFEMAYNSSIMDSMRVITILIKECIDYIKNSCREEISTLGFNLPDITKIPALSFNESMEIIGKTDCVDIDPTDEVKLTEYAREKHSCEFLFVTNLPRLKQPFYSRDRENFILIYKGLCVAHGSENISDYDELMTSLKNKSLCPDDYKAFTEPFKYGMPPHGGGAIEIERFVSKLLDLDNIRKAILFPRDLHHITP